MIDQGPARVQPDGTMKDHGPPTLEQEDLSAFTSRNGSRSVRPQGLDDQQTRNRLAWISSLAEPLIIVFLGTAVGFYVIALFMPFVTLIQNLS